MQTPQQTVEAVIHDIVQAEIVLWAGLICVLGDKGVIDVTRYVDGLEANVSTIKENTPDHPLGDGRYDTFMMQAIADALKGKPKPKPPSWTPRVIAGGKS
ncbi:MAG: hypothetical protein AB7F09_15805 [Parvibaculaceae bacterium]